MADRRAYSILRLADGVVFQCLRCSFNVNVKDFSGAKSARTQAATAINEHCRKHPRAYHDCEGVNCEVCRRLVERYGADAVAAGAAPSAML